VKLDLPVLLENEENQEYRARLGCLVNKERWDQLDQVDQQDQWVHQGKQVT